MAPHSAKVVALVRGGLGNQLFCYAAARRLAVANNAELVVDHETFFRQDWRFQRHYQLDHFHIPCRKATSAERLEPLGRVRRALQRRLSRRRPFHQRNFLEQKTFDFDSRLLDYRVARTVYLDGYWQSEEYFKDIADQIRQDLVIKPPEDEPNRLLARRLENTEAVSIHIRWFDHSADDLPAFVCDYYRRALDSLREWVENPLFVIFSDRPKAARQFLNLEHHQSIWPDHNRGEEAAYADLWLMSRCRHFIMADSTFSWWGAWLGERPGSRVIAPKRQLLGDFWCFSGLLPDRWLHL